MKEQFDSLDNLLLFNMKQPVPSITELKILEFRDLNNGWAYGNGVKFSDSVIKDAIKIHNLIADYGFLETGAFPGENGEILITVYADELYCEVFVYENNIYDFIIEMHDEEIVSKENIDFNNLTSELKLFRIKSLCSSLEQYTQTTTTQEKGGIKVRPSTTPAIMAGSQSSRKIVSSKQQGVFVHILKNSMEKFPGIQSYSGNLTYPLYRLSM